MAYSDRKNIKELDGKKVQEYKRNMQYEDLADYMSGFYSDDASEQSDLYFAINTYRRQGRRLNSMLNRATSEEDRMAIQFNYGLETGNLPDKYLSTANGKPEYIDNIYTKAYKNSIYNLGGHKATDIEIVFDDNNHAKLGDLTGGLIKDPLTSGLNWLAKDEKYPETGFELYCANNGLSKEDLINMGAEFSNIDGRVVMKVNKNNTNIHRIFMGLKNCTTDYTSSSPNVSQYNENAEARYMIRGLDADGNETTEDNDYTSEFNNIFDRNDKTRGYIRPHVKGLATYANTNLMFDKRVPGKRRMFAKAASSKFELSDMYTIMEEADKKQSSALSPFTLDDSRTTMEDIVTTGFGSLMIQKLEKDIYSGKVSKETGALMLKRFDENYRNRLKTVDLTQYEVYSNAFNEDDESGMYQMSNIRRRQLTNYLNSAFAGGLPAEGATYVAGTMGGKNGVFITIPAKVNTKGKLERWWDELWGPEEVHEGETVRIFVPELWNDTVEQTLQNDPDCLAAIDYNDMKKYGYSMDVPGIGKLSVNPDGTCGIKPIEEGNSPFNLYNEARGVASNSDVKIDREQALEFIRKANIYDYAQRATLDELTANHYFEDRNVNNDGYRTTFNSSLLNISQSLLPLIQKYISKTDWDRFQAALYKKQQGIPLDAQDLSDIQRIRRHHADIWNYVMNSIGQNIGLPKQIYD